MCSEYKISDRFTILLFATLSLIIAILNFVDAFFSVKLIYQARPKLSTINTTGTSNDEFGTLIVILSDGLITAAITASSAIHGAVISIHPSWLPRHKDSIIPTYAFSQILQAVFLIVTGGYLAQRVSGIQPSFRRITGNDGISYSSVMYYGGVAQAVYGSALVLVCITMALANSMANYFEGRQKRVKKPAKQVRRVARVSAVELAGV